LVSPLFSLVESVSVISPKIPSISQGLARTRKGSHPARCAWRLGTDSVPVARCLSSGAKSNLNLDTAAASEPGYKWPYKSIVSLIVEWRITD